MLNLFHITSTFHIIAMFVTADLTTFPTRNIQVQLQRVQIL
jgi:hypothetical protein